MRLQASSGGLTIGETDNRYFRVNATTNGYQRINCNGALGYAYDGLRVDHAWQDAGNDWTAFRVSADTTGGAGSGSAALAVDINSVRRFAFKTSGNIEQTGASVSADAPLWNASQTWNNAGVNFTALKVNVVNTASGSASKLADFKVGGTSQFSVFKDGKVGMTTSGFGQFLWQQHDTYGFALKSPDNNWVFCAQNDGGIAALNVFAASTGRIAFKNTTFHAGAVWQNQSIGLERQSDDKIKVTNSGGAIRDFRASDYYDANDNRILTSQQAAVASASSPDASDLASAITLVNELKSQLNAALARLRSHGLIAT